MKRGETLWGIAQHSGNKLPAVVKDNPQIANPNLIRPGEIVFVPEAGTQAKPPRGHQATPPAGHQAGGTSPDPQLKKLVTDAHGADQNVTSLQKVADDPKAPAGERKLAGEALNVARQSANAAWQKVQDAVADKLRSGSAAKFQTALKGVRAQFAGDSKFQQAVDKAYGPVKAVDDAVGRVEGAKSALGNSGARAAIGAGNLQQNLNSAQTALNSAVGHEIDGMAGPNADEGAVATCRAEDHGAIRGRSGRAAGDQGGNSQPGASIRYAQSAKPGAALRP